MAENDSVSVEAVAVSVDAENTAGESDAVETCSTKPSSSSLEDLFRDRYTMENESFAKICEGFDPVICIHPFHSRARRNFENNGGHRRGGWGNGQRGDWRGGRGRGHWRDDRRRRDDWRDEGRGQRRPWNDRSHQDDGGPKRARHD